MNDPIDERYRLLANKGRCDDDVKRTKCAGHEEAFFICNGEVRCFYCDRIVR